MTDNTGWTFSNEAELDWQSIGEGVAMKMMGVVADGRRMIMFKFDPGFAADSHEHLDSEFAYVLEGSVVSNGVLMEAGHSYAASTGTTHEEFRTESGATVLTVLPAPPG